MIKQMWVDLRSQWFRRKPSDTENWENWTEALQTAEDLPTWDGFLNYDCSPLGELMFVVESLEKKADFFPAIAQYIGDRIKAPPFGYQPLDFQSNSIRLVRINLNTPYLPAAPGQGCLFVELSMTHFRSDEIPEYHALSYVWGDTSYKALITVDGKTISITRNLLIILSQLRQETFHGWLWIDALCIDQRNKSEKDLHLRQIPSIYKEAKSTLAWVGKYTEIADINHESSLFCLSKMRIIIQNLLNLPAAESMSREDDKGFCSTSIDVEPPRLLALLSKDTHLVTKIMAHITGMLNSEGNEWLKALHSLFSHPIWTRIWIVQEFASSRNVILTNGEEQVELGILFDIWAVLYHGINQDANVDSEILPPNIRSRIKSIAPMLLLSNVLGTQREPRTLFELLRATGWFCASDPRDKMFALLGIAVDAPELAISPSYEGPFNDTFINVSEALIYKYGSSMLSFNAGYGHVGWKLPSWCSDWRKGTSYTILTDRHPGGTPFNTRGTEKGPASVAFDRVEGTMSITGIVAGSVRDVQKCHATDFDTNPAHAVFKLLLQLQDLTGIEKQQNCSSSPTYLEEALFCVPIAYQKPLASSSVAESQRGSQRMIEAYREVSVAGQMSNDSPTGPVSLSRSNTYVQEAIKRAAGRAIFVCEDNLLGLGPMYMQKGDLICIFKDSSVPSILRSLPNSRFLYLGEAYVHGMMYGEYFESNNRFNHSIFVIE